MRSGHVTAPGWCITAVVVAALATFVTADPVLCVAFFGAPSVVLATNKVFRPFSVTATRAFSTSRVWACADTPSCLVDLSQDVG